MIETKVSYPYVEGFCGIPFDQISAPFQGFIKGGSGREIYCEINSDDGISWFEVEDIKNGFNMRIAVSRDTAVGEIYTRNLKGERHPDFFAKKFLSYALEHFTQQGYKITVFDALWLKNKKPWGSINYTEFKKNLKDGSQPKEAAKDTWTGRVMAELGFTEVESAYEYDGSVFASFKKPDGT